MVNDDVRRIFQTRSRVIQFIRRYLDERGFLEVGRAPLGRAEHGGLALWALRQGACGRWGPGCSGISPP
jgi:elongation factor P--beta-lysine ligase